MRECRDPEWDFAAIPASDEAAACAYEYCREGFLSAHNPPWLALSPERREREREPYRKMAEGRGGISPMRLLNGEEEREWANKLVRPPNPDEDMGNFFTTGDVHNLNAQIACFLLNLGTYTDVEIVSAFEQELSVLRRIHGKPNPNRRGKKDTEFRARLDWLGWMRLRHLLPRDEVVAIARSRGIATRGSAGDVIEAVDALRRKARAHYHRFQPFFADAPRCWILWAERPQK